MQSTDNLKIETPEQIALELPLAGIGSRFLAIAFDTLLQFIVGVVGILIFAFVGAFEGAGKGGAWAAALFILLMFCLYWGYFAFFEIIWKGQTPGKRHAGIRVIKDSGRPLNAFEAIARNLMRVIDWLPGMYGVGILTMAINSKNRRLGDYVAGTVVVHDKPTDEISPTWTGGGEVSTGELRVSGIKPEELVLIETYLNRRFEIDPSIRAATVQRIVDMVSSKTGLQVAPGQSQDDFLESVAREVRNNARFH